MAFFHGFPEHDCCFQATRVPTDTFPGRAGEIGFKLLHVAAIYLGRFPRGQFPL